jgi:ABC-2 type transport system permease protein
MRHVRVFLLYFQEALESRSRSLVWFLITLINPLIFFLFWRGALGGQPAMFGSLSLSSIASYYFLLIIAGSFLQVHIEESVAYFDIQEGLLANYLVHPYPYIWSKFFTELPYRFIQGSFGLVIFFLFRLAYGELVSIEQSLPLIMVCILITVLAFWISFLFKMILGLSALWTTDFRGLAELAGVFILLAGGFIVPLDLLPPVLQRVVYIFPFPYMIYFPIIAWMGKLPLHDLVRVVLNQVMWVAGLGLVYRLVWRRGVRKFTGVGL